MKEPKYKNLATGLNHLSLGISMVVAVLIGVAIGIFLNNIFDNVWLLFLGIFWGVASAGLNVYKAYKKQQKEYEIFEQEAKEVEKILEENNKK
jgi:F0F1-type ATP synthase assembly protein I